MPTYADECDQMMVDIVGVLGRSITLTSVSISATLNTSTGSRTETTASQSISAAERPAAQEVVSGGQGRTLRDERIYDVRAADVTIGGSTPKVGWRVTDGSWTGEVVNVEKGANRTAFTLTCRKAS